jgi:AraC-like DNA-binding protein
MLTDEQATIELLTTLDLDPNSLLGSAKKITAKELIYSLIKFESIQDSAIYLGISRNTLKTIISKNLDSCGETGPALTWQKYLLSLINSKKCTNCLAIKYFSEFNKDNSKSLKVQAVCKECDYSRSKAYRENNREAYLEYLNNYRIEHAKEYTERTRKYQLSKKQRLPAWANLEKIKEIYSNCPEGCHVDHMVPLNGTTVSGLHVENNLQYLSAKENIAKSNKWECD